MMGLEPTTFGMATGPFIRAMFALDRIAELNLGCAAEASSKSKCLDLRTSQADLGTSA
jgi:hypothetical protein